MERWKKLLFKLLFPHNAVIVLVVLAAVALMVYTFVIGRRDDMIAYITYILSAYALTVVCARTPALFRRVKSIKEENRYIKRYTSDVHLRIKISLYSSVAMNTIYALMQFWSGFYFGSVWFYALGGYYALLALMRYFLLKETLKDKPGEKVFWEYLHYRLCGVLLLVMNLVLSGIVFCIVWENRGFEYHFIHTIAMAAYTFAAMTMAVVNVVRYRRYESPVLSAAKAISLVSALVSMLTLETAMLTAFGEADQAAFRQIMTGSTGAAVCIAVLAIAIYMIMSSTKKINQIKRGDQVDG